MDVDAELPSPTNPLDANLAEGGGQTSNAHSDETNNLKNIDGGTDAAVAVGANSNVSLKNDDSMVTDNDTSTTTTDAPKVTKKSRKRKKHIFNDVRQSMEFYFSDANLSKDRFLMRLIEKDPEVPLSTFMNFNKIKALVSSVNEIEKAISSSELLRLSDDRTKVARRADLSSLEARCPDDCTIYVEALPPTATHDWVRKVFEQYGPVAYVSLPKYRSTQRIKEFAFVEFEQRSSVLRVMKTFAEFGGALNATSDPEKLGSVLAYLQEQEDAGDGNASDAAEPMQSQSSLADGQRKRKASDEECSTKKPRKEGDEENVEPTAAAAAEIEQSVGDATDDVGTADDDADDAEDGDNRAAAAAKVRRKKPTSKHHQPIKTPIDVRFDPSASVSSMRITTKLEWKRLRNKYLNHQRDTVKQMKKQLWLQRRAAVGAGLMPTHDAGGQGGNASADAATAEQSAGNINFYGARNNKNNHKQQPKHEKFDADGGESDSKHALFAKRSDNSNVDGGNTSEASLSKDAAAAAAASTLDAAKAKAPLFSFEPGIIVRVHFTAPCVDVKDFKAEMRQHACVRYVDVREGDQSAYVRVDAGPSAVDLMAKVAPLQAEVVKGADEEAYWQKMHTDRQQKLNKELSIKPKRGREKVRATVAAAAVAQQTNHVRFDD